MEFRDQAAAIYLRHRTPVWRDVRRLTASGDLADDLCQEVFLRVVAGLAGYRERGVERAWVFQIARRVLADHWRTEAGAAPVPGPDAPATGPVQAPVQLLRVSLAEALARLSAADREVLLLREVAGLRHPEIAAVLGVSEAAVQYRLRRTRTRLQRAVVWEPRHLTRDKRGEGPP